MVLAPSYLLISLLLFAQPRSPAATDVKPLLQEFLRHVDLKDPPDVGRLGDRLDSLRAAPATDVREILPLARSLLHSPNRNLRTVGQVTLVAIALRSDSAELLAPDIPELVTSVGDPDRAVSGTALTVLGSLHPKPPSTIVASLLPFLADNKLPEVKLQAISGVLLAAAPDDPAAIGAILNLLQDHTGPQMKAEIVRMMGAAHVVNERTLALFSAGLTDADPDVRLMAAQSVGWQRSEVIRRFVPQLRKIVEDTAEKPSTRSYALAALKQVDSR